MGKGTHSITFIFHNTDNITICVPQLLPARISNTILLLIVSIPYGVIFYHEFQDTLCHVEMGIKILFLVIIVVVGIVFAPFTLLPRGLSKSS